MDVSLRENDSQTMPGKDVKAAKKITKASNPNNLKFKNGPKKFKKRRKNLKKGRGLIYLGRIPHGFYEDQMTAYFNQFGKVISAVVPRSEKSGRSKGYGYVEFEDEEVAKIAAEAMNNYLMYNKIIKCRYIPPEERRKSGLLRGKTMHTCPGVLNRIKNANEKRESLSKLSLSAYQKKTQKKIAEFKKFFEERGIDFNFKADIKNSKDVGSSSSSSSSSNDSEKDEMKGSSNADEGMEEEIEDQFGVLEIDASDGEIHFKIPPQVKKVIKKSSSSVITPKHNSKMSKKVKTKRQRKSSLQESEKIVKPKEMTGRATRNLKKKVEVKEETLKRVLKKEKDRSLKKKNDTVLKQKKLGIKVIASTLKKEKNNMQQKSPKLNCGKHSSKILSGEKK